MDTLVDLSWRIYPAVALMAVGTVIALLGTRREIDGIRRPQSDPAKLITWVRGFRLAIIGAAVAATGAAWAWHLTWLLVLALAIGGEETLEGTLILFALTRGRYVKLRLPGG